MEDSEDDRCGQILDLEYDSGSYTDLFAEHIAGQILRHPHSTVPVHYAFSYEVDPWASLYHTVQDEQKRTSALAIA